MSEFGKNSPHPFFRFRVIHDLGVNDMCAPANANYPEHELYYDGRIGAHPDIAEIILKPEKNKPASGVAIIGSRASGIANLFEYGGFLADARLAIERAEKEVAARVAETQAGLSSIAATIRRLRRKPLGTHPEGP